MPYMSSNATCGKIEKYEDAIKYIRKKLIECVYSDIASHKEDKRFMRHLATCITKYVPVDLQEFHIFDRIQDRRVHERKWFLPYMSRNDDCKWLTVGIGGKVYGIEGQQQVNSDLSFCKLYGIEAINSSHGDYAKYGTVIPHAVGPEDGVHLLEIYDEGRINIRTEVMQIRAMHKLLDEYVGSRIIHFATFDIEGYEKKLIDGIMYQGNITKNNVIFCQIDWELHKDSMYEKLGLKADRVKTLISLIKNSPYLPILISPQSLYNQHQVILLYVEDSPCKTPFMLEEIFNRTTLC
uniref:Methyltransferase FkbM domain-containing protein n=1 Tax=Acrobeloides nanus TaxID=290746 RepID=A0A914DMI0_9BILA